MNMMMDQDMNLMHQNLNFNLMVSNKMEFLFHQMNPEFRQDNEEDIKMKKNWENIFLNIFNLIVKKENDNKKTEEEKKIILNFYDVCSTEVYCDLNLSIENIISIILSKLYNKGKICIKRTNKNQTTKYVIENPVKIPENYKRFFDIELNPLYFEFEGINLFTIEEKKGCDIGLKEGSQIQLKINNDIIKILKKGLLTVNF